MESDDPINVSVLCVSKRSVYKTLFNIDCYDINRDCRTFTGSNPVVCHPPCRSWSAHCRHQAKPLPGERELALFCVEKLISNGGLLEHPANSKLWDELNLPKPGDKSRDGFWSIRVDQSWFGDERVKKTWLLFYGVNLYDLPEIPFLLHDKKQHKWDTMSKTKRSSTPRDMALWLIEAARKSTVK